MNTYYILAVIASGARLTRIVLLWRREAIYTPQTTFFLEHNETRLLGDEYTTPTIIVIISQVLPSPIPVLYEERLGSVLVIKNRHHCEPQACGTR